MISSWLYLFIAGLFEMGWPVGLKIANEPKFTFFGITFAIIAMTLSGIFLFLAQKTIPIGPAYAIWTGCGTVETFLIGILFFNDPKSLISFIGVILILSGITVLKLSLH